MRRGVTRTQLLYAKLSGYYKLAVSRSLRKLLTSLCIFVAILSRWENRARLERPLILSWKLEFLKQKCLSTL